MEAQLTRIVRKWRRRLVYYAQSRMRRLGIEVTRRERYLEMLTQLEASLRHANLIDLSVDRGRLPLLGSLLGTSPAEGLFLLHHLHSALESPGDVCEFGVAQGATSALLANEIRAMDTRDLWLFDSFIGLDRPSKKDSLINDIFGLREIHKYEGAMSGFKDEVMSRLATISFPRRRIHLVEEFVTLDWQPRSFPSSICFAYVDFDLYEATRAALGLIHPVLSHGGVIAIDDYGFFSTGPETAVEEFLGECHGYELQVAPEFVGRVAVLIKRGNSGEIGGTSGVPPNRRTH